MIWFFIPNLPALSVAGDLIHKLFQNTSWTLHAIRKNRLVKQCFYAPG